MQNPQQAEQLHTMTTWRFIRYWLYLGHRWLGIFGCLLFVIWFASGLVLSYVGYPQLDADKRRSALQPIAWAAIRVGPDELLSDLWAATYPREFRLEMLLDEPVYRVTEWDGSRRTISAVTGGNVASIDAEDAVSVAEHYAQARGAFRATIDHDQWTVPERFAPMRPLQQIVMADDERTHIYVSARTGEVVLATTHWQRFWNWIGAVPHWIYFTKLRADQPLWRQVNLWISGAAILIAVSGIWLGILRLRVQHRYAGGSMSPYDGFRLWHHWAGICGGVFLLSWVLSGWLSVNPNQWLSSGAVTQESLLRYAGQANFHFEADLKRLGPQNMQGAREVHFVYFDGTPLLHVLGRQQATDVLDAATGTPAGLSDEQVFSAAGRLLLHSNVISRKRIEREDAYWYSHHDKRPLPVLRVTFDDDDGSSFYLNPKTGAVLELVDNGARRYRWWFNALHRLDFAWLTHNTMVWRATIWVLCGIGLIISTSGAVLGWRRLRRKSHVARHA